MTDEETFQAALDADPDDRVTRLVFADWLQDRNDPRAEGYRALAAVRKRPMGNVVGMWWASDEEWKRSVNVLPRDWFVVVTALRPDWTVVSGLCPGRWRVGEAGPDRRQLEDAAALAFAKLDPDLRAGLLKVEVLV